MHPNVEDASRQDVTVLPLRRLKECSRRAGNDVIVLDEQIETEELETVCMPTSWDSHVEQEEASWPTRFPTQKPFIKPRVEQVDDNWYQGEDCVDPSGIAPVARRGIL